DKPVHFFDERVIDRDGDALHSSPSPSLDANYVSFAYRHHTSPPPTKIVTKSSDGRMRLASVFVGLVGIIVRPGFALGQLQLPATAAPPPPPKKAPAKTAQPTKKTIPTTATTAGAQVASGAPNVGGGPALAPSLASEITVPGTDLNAR